MKSLLQFFLALGLLFVMNSCRSTRKIQTAITKKDTVQTVVVPEVDLHADSIRFMKASYRSIEKNIIPFQTFSAKVKVDFEDKDGKKNEVNAFIRLKKDSLMWVKIDAIIGIEAFRLMITPDSVKMMNKLDKIIQIRSINDLQDITHLPFNFEDLQNLIMGNPLYLDSNIVSYKNSENAISFTSIGNLFKHFLTVDNNRYLLQNSKLDDADPSRARTCLLLYKDYQPYGEQFFSTTRQISFTEKNKLDIQLEFKQYTFNESLTYPFSIPKNYKQK